MKYVRMKVENGYYGCDQEVYLKFEDNISEEELDAEAIQMMEENAEDFEYTTLGDWVTEESREDYYDNCSWEWEFITEEEYLDNV